MRLEISNRTDIALRALRTLDGRDEPLPRSDLADRLETTPAYLPQVLAPLVDAGWVVSKPGPKGGYLPGRPASTISVCDLIQAIEGPIDDGQCVLDGGDCSEQQPCAMHGAWSRARDALVDQLMNSPVL